jgi:putative RNA 2'-phosphotransferase
VNLSKFLSLVLRHRPEAVGIQLDPGGWVDIETLLEHCEKRGRVISRSLLEEVVQTNNKQRFAISEDGIRIRASQGHSVPIELGYARAVPPEVLYHGSVAERIKAIQSQGLRKMKRHHVHLSPDAKTARGVGSRRGAPIVLRIHAGQMHRDGHVFYLSANHVWLTDRVPSEYINVVEGEAIHKK